MAASTGYFNCVVDELTFRQPFINPTDFVAAAVLIACVLVLCWYVWGKILTTVMIVAIAYYAFGRHLPWPFNYQTPETGIVMTYLAGLGGSRGLLWGIPLSANVIFLIIVYGGALKGARVLEMFNELGKTLMTVTRGGIAYSSILAATAIGMVTGQPVANVALAGSITIPSMKEQGFSPETSGALVTLASLGSQLLPPIMGLGGFLIAVNIGVPYVEIAAAAIIPALLYMLTMVIAAFFMAQNTPTLKTLTVKPDYRAVAWIMPSFLISFTVLIYLLYKRYSPEYAAFWSLGLLTVTCFLRPAAYRPNVKEFLSGLRFGVGSAAQLALILAGIGLVVQVLITTGAGFDIGRFLMGAAGGNMVLTLIFGMLLAAFAGLGLPTPAAYALIAIIAVPFLTDLGVTSVPAHFFGFYFAVFSAITPPVAVACMAAARIAGASFYRTVLESGKIAVIAILIPYAFVAFPSLLDFPILTVNTMVVAGALLLATVAWAAALYGWLLKPLLWVERAVLGLGPVAYVWMLLTQNLWVGLSPVVILAIVVGLVLIRGVASRHDHVEPSHPGNSDARASGSKDPTGPSSSALSWHTGTEREGV